jgi:hypothetical protein
MRGANCKRAAHINARRPAGGRSTAGPGAPAGASRPAGLDAVLMPPAPFFTPRGRRGLLQSIRGPGPREAGMSDLVMVALVVVFFAASLAFVARGASRS